LNRLFKQLLRYAHPIVRIFIEAMKIAQYISTLLRKNKYFISIISVKVYLKYIDAFM